ncbi:MAG: Gfo/Idh/MocA family oxidoreductase [Candidatus Aminicenantes bacterium]|nr:Gfo/Idh/MocA family oxidoreductase [Candidatus Aminicenantes bacterium]
MSAMNRRDALKTIGTLAAGTALPARPAAAATPRQAPAGPKLARPLTAVVLGAGNRGNVYAGYADAHADELRIVGVAEPVAHKNERFAKKYGITDEHRFVTWEHALDIPKFADLVFITMPDRLHYLAAMKGLEVGYDLLLEKAIAQSWAQCRNILVQSRTYDRIVAVCHVLRYTPYFRKLKELVDNGTIGDVVSIQHLEPVEHIHMSHSFVRGPWRNSIESTPMILSKSCHDLDILRWIIDKPCRRVQSFGSQSKFIPARAPQGAPRRCTDGCPVEAECPFSALKVYLGSANWLGHLNLKTGSKEEILQALKTGPYGRCVYHCDNDVVDHQVVNMEFEGGVTAAFSMEGLTTYAGRRTRIMGTRGDLVGDEETIRIGDFAKKTVATLAVKDFAVIDSGHGGGDYGLVHDLLRSVDRRDPALLTSTIEASMESHLMGFAAEDSRLAGGKAVETRIEEAV